MIMTQNKFRITQKDFLIANRRASRLEEIEAHGHPVIPTIHRKIIIDSNWSPIEIRTVIIHVVAVLRYLAMWSSGEKL